MMNRTIVHFEIPANDVEKLAGFYRGLFGWKVEKAEGMDYWMIETAPEGQGLNGGMMKRQMPEQVPTNYVQVESVDQYATRLVELGGKIVVPKQEIPEMGYFAIFLDPEGNCFGLFEEKAK